MKRFFLNLVLYHNIIRKFFLLFISILFLLVINTVYANDNSQSKKIKVGYFEFNGFHQNDKNGNKSGYDIDYLQKISQYTGWEYEYIEGTWEECLKMLEKGEIDILGLMQKTDERLELYDFANIDSGESHGVLYTSQDKNIAYEDFKTFNGLKVGILNGSARNINFMKYQEENGFSSKMKIYDTENELTTALKNKEVDAIAITNLRKTHNEKMIAQFHPSLFYFATTKGNTYILNLLNKALSEIRLSTPYFNYTLYKKYYSKDKAQLATLSSKEIEFVKNNPKLTTVYDPAWYPIEYYDKKTKEFSGSTSGIFNLISEYSGLEFEFIKTDSYQQSYEMVQKNEADILSGTMMDSLDNMIFTDDYYKYPLVTVGQKGTSINKNTVIAIPENYTGISEISKNIYPELEIRFYKTMEDCLNLIKKKSYNMITIENSYIINNLLLSPDYDNIGIISVTENIYGMKIGVSKSIDPILVSILNKSISQISENQKNAIMFSYTTDVPYKPSLNSVLKQYSLFVTMVIFVFFTIIIFIILYSRKKEDIVLKKIAYTDILTNGINLAKFKLNIDSLFKLNTMKKYAIVYFDIDKFKYINEIYGFETGNNTLKNIYNVFYEHLNKDEMFTRITADYFLTLIEYISDEYTIYRLQNIFDKINEYYKKDDKHYKLILSCGIYILEKNDIDINLIIDRANIARKTVKGNHKTTYAFYSNEIRDKIIKEKEIENMMSLALENKEFKVYMQPKYDMFCKKVVGAEALVRWDNPQKGIIMPNDFIPLFENNGFIIDLDTYVFKTVCEKIQWWINKGYTPIPISINVSRVNLYHKDFVNRCKELISNYDFSPQFIELELTESILFGNSDIAIEIMTKLKSIGFQISMNDFGSAYSSLNMLEKIPIDILKLNKEFILETANTEHGKAIISKVIEMAKVIKIKVISEGVETNEQIEFLKTTGCDMVQGFLFAKPMPMEEIDKLILRNQHL